MCIAPSVFHVTSSTIVKTSLHRPENILPLTSYPAHMMGCPITKITFSSAPISMAVGGDVISLINIKTVTCKDGTTFAPEYPTVVWSN